MNFKWLWSLALLPTIFVTRKLRNDPEFGGRPEGSYLARLKNSPHWKMGQFRNLDKTPIREDLRSLVGDLMGYLKAKDTFPSISLPSLPKAAAAGSNHDGHFLTWLGHSAMQLETNGQCVLLDPMLGDWVAPIPFLGHRFPYLASPAQYDFTRIDLVVYSHDHYDHLDRTTVLRLDPVVKQYLVPLGVGVHLQSWGVEAKKITEMDWWQTVIIHGVAYTFTPARHFGGRSPIQRNKSLWGSYAIRLDEATNIYFGGDSGYGRHFKQIGERLGPFDLTMLDCGQYHERWKNVHMFPEEAVLAHRELKGRQLLPIHWGGFSLSNHPWLEPVQRILAADEARCVITPGIGEKFKIGDPDYCGSKWWESKAENDGNTATTSVRA